jgi:hypothetical protein
MAINAFVQGLIRGSTLWNLAIIVAREGGKKNKKCKKDDKPTPDLVAPTQGSQGRGSGRDQGSGKRGRGGGRGLGRDTSANGQQMDWRSMPCAYHTVTAPENTPISFAVVFLVASRPAPLLHFVLPSKASPVRRA